MFIHSIVDMHADTSVTHQTGRESFMGLTQMLVVKVYYIRFGLYFKCLQSEFMFSSYKGEIHVVTAKYTWDEDNRTLLYKKVSTSTVLE